MCPNPACRSTSFESNLIDETPFTHAANGAHALRQVGHPLVAAGVLTALGGVRIANFLRKKWKCLSCGATFDD